MSDLAGIKSRYESLLATEDSKDRIIADLFSHIEALQDELRNEKDEVDNSKRLVASFKDEKNEYKSQLQSLHREQGKLSYVSVLVDGDGMNFREDLIQDGKNGGREAARRLIQAVEGHVQTVDPDAPSNTSYKIRVYANVEGLTNAYRDAHILAPNQDLTTFIRGFNKENTLCDFVDVGSGKECSDVKLQALFNHDIANVHCRRIIFCASADNGYARVLEPHRESTCISLVEGPPFAYELRELAANFATTSIPNVFMANKLKPSRRVSFSATDTTTTTITPPRTPTPNYASAARAAPPSQPSTPATTSPPHSAPRPRLSMCVNSRGQRVDRPLQYSSKENFNLLKRKKMCNRFHLLGSCPYEDCTHTHGPPLSSQEIIDLKYIARFCVCPNGLFCDDVKCICGHRCPWEKCTVNPCKFPETMHGVDINITRELKGTW